MAKNGYISLRSCKDGYLYEIQARNSWLGIFNAAEKGFIISRIKFDSNYLFTEYHWGVGQPFGTVKPTKEIEKAPVFTLDEGKLAWLNKKLQEIPDGRTWS